MTVEAHPAECAQARSYQRCSAADSFAREKLGSILKERAVSWAAKAQTVHSDAPVTTHAVTNNRTGRDRGRVTSGSPTDGPTEGSAGLDARPGMRNMFRGPLRRR